MRQLTDFLRNLISLQAWIMDKNAILGGIILFANSLFFVFQLPLLAYNSLGIPLYLTMILMFFANAANIFLVVKNVKARETARQKKYVETSQRQYESWK